MSANVEFFQGAARPDWILTGTFAPSRRDVWGETWRRFMGIDAGPVMLPEGAQVHMLTPQPQPASTCRYCKVPRTKARTTCDNCGAPYPALVMT